MRVQLASRGLRLTGFQLGPQRMGATEVRVTLQWQGPLGASLEMWQALALDMPQMVLDAWVMQALPDHEWRVVWRGQWQKTAVPQPLPPRPPAIEGLTAYARTGFFDPLVLRRELARLWPQGQPSAALLRLVRPDDLRLEAVMHLPEPMAWLSWHQQALSVRVGDRIGEEGGRVQAIGNDHVVIVQGGRVWRVLATAVAVPEKETP